MRFGALFAVVPLLSSCGQGAATAETSAEPTTLKARIAAAAPGDTIRLAPGNYGALVVRDRNRLTIAGGTFTGITVRGGSGISFVDTRVEVEPPVRHTPMVNIMDATDVAFTRLSVNALPAADETRKGYGVNILRSTGVTITGLSVTGSAKGMVIQSSKAVTVRDATLERLQSDGIQVGNLDGATFENISVGELKPKPGDHPDGFQASNAIANVTIRHFRFRSTGDGDGQGIFISDAKPPARHANLVLEDVEIANRFGRCVSIDQADGVRLRNIACTSRPPYIDRPGLYLKDVSGLDSADVSACKQARDRVSGKERRTKTVKCR